jgi:hypothetical protein
MNENALMLQKLNMPDNTTGSKSMIFERRASHYMGI